MVNGVQFRWLFLFLFLAINSPGQVVINEILADNTVSVSNGDTYPDYVELYNPSAQTVDLAGFSLTDNLLQPFKYSFPANTLLAPGARLVVWCDSQVTAPGLHTGFALSKDGEAVGLYNASSALLDSVTFGLQLPDLSLGRVPDATGGWVLTTPTPGLTNVVQPLGTAAALRFNEWMANVSPAADWFEVYNTTNLPVPLAGLVFTDQPATPATNRAIPSLSFIRASGFTQFFADDLTDPGAGHLDFKLSSTSGETLRLYAANRTTLLDSVTFGPQEWNTSEGRLPDGGANIVLFGFNAATPAESNFSAVTNVVVSELLTHADVPLEDAVELSNPTTQAVDISHWWLSDTPDNPKRYRFPAGTVIPAGGFKVIYEYQFNSNGLGFTYNSFEAGEVVLCSGDASGALTGARLRQPFGAAANGVSFVRLQTSRGVDFVAASQRTFGHDNPVSLVDFRGGTGLSNAYPIVGPIVLSEIMYHPPDVLVGGIYQDNLQEEYIELFNATGTAVPLYDPLYPTNQWRIRKGVDFDFPPGLSLASGARLLLVGWAPTNTALLQAFRTKYGVPVEVTILGPFIGKLDNGGETLELLKPDPPQPPGRPKAGLVPYVVVDRVAYLDLPPWPIPPDGSGQSLQRRSAVVHGNDPVHWFSALPTPGRPNAIERPRIEAATVTTNGLFKFQFTALAGVAYSVQWQTTLAEPYPETLTNIPPALETRVVQVTDPSPPSNGPGRFYKILFPSEP